ncbi:MAG TPA: flavodoxin domain-containing protein [Pseudonocardiaceae bacterium]
MTTPATPTRRPSVLVVHASRMGGTAGIAEQVAEVLAAAGLGVSVQAAEGIGDREVARHDAVVLGSAVYFRRWRRPAVRFLRRERERLAERPVFLFQSGPCGDEDAHRQLPAPPGVRRLAARIGAEQPVTFGGRLDAEHAGGWWMARRMASGPLAGDWRDPEAIRDWASDVAGRILRPADQSVPGAS